MTHINQESKKSFLELASSALRESGGRMTRPRLAVVDCLSKASRPLSVQEIFDKLNLSTQKVKIDRVSVYRIIEALHARGLVHPVGATGKFLACFHSQCHAGQHMIIACSVCHLAQEVDLPSSIAKSLQSYLLKQYNFSSKGHGLFLDGCCQSCARKQGH